MDFAMEEKPKIQEVNLDCTLSEKEYRKRLDKLQDKLLKLSYKLYKKQIPLIICYEGWDAAGKGGNIKRLVSCFDARDYEVHPVAAPDIQEKNHHYLWRFWKNLPKNGHIEVFDRTWYGRVMVERLEGFNSKVEWQRAYNEINEFEEELTDWGAIVIKFWLQIDKDEQLARFTERQNNPAKQWKITDEDWRNREKWDAYEVAVNEMIQYTSTVNAPWHIIESNNKYYARIKAIETVVDAIEKRLGK
jgi:polyphosphate kinase 2 (PPK2 family)